MNQICISNNKRKKRKNNNNNVLILGSHQLCSFSRDLQVLSWYILSKKPKKIPRNYRDGYSVRILTVAILNNFALPQKSC